MPNSFIGEVARKLGYGVTLYYNEIGCQAVYDALKPSRQWGSIQEHIRQLAYRDLYNLIAVPATEENHGSDASFHDYGSDSFQDSAAEAFPSSFEDESLTSSTETSSSLPESPPPGTVLRSVYEGLLQKNLVVRESFLEFLHLHLQIGKQCTIRVKQQATLMSKGNRRGLNLHLRCSSKNCFSLIVRFLELRGDDSTVAFEVEFLSQARKHKFSGARRMFGDYRTHVCEKASLAGGAVPYTRQLKKKLQNQETIPASVPHSRAVQKAIYHSRLPSGIARLPGFDVESLFYLHRSQGIEFVRTLSAVPYQVTFATDLQLEIYSKYSNRVLYLDATGSVVRKSNNRSPPVFIYSAVFESPASGLHPGAEQMALPVFEYITNSHTTLSISWFLSNLKYALAKLEGGTKNLPRQVVIDYCWASIHAVLHSLAPHSTNLISFLRDKYRIMLKERVSAKAKDGVFKLSLCRSHMLHAWTRHKSFGRSNKNRRQQKSVLIRGALMMGNAKTLTEAEIIYRKLCTVCLEERTTAEVSKYVKEFSSLSDPDAEDAIGKDAEPGAEESKHSSKKPDSHAEFDDDQLPTLESINRQSPFSQHFNPVYRAVKARQALDGRETPDGFEDEAGGYEDSFGGSNDEENSHQNWYRNPDFLTYFNLHWIPLFALWSEMTAGKEEEDRDEGEIQAKVPTNGFVERYFRELKSTRLSSRQPLAPVPFLQKQYEFLQAHAAAIVADLEEWPAEKANKKKQRSQSAKRRSKVPYNEPLPQSPTIRTKQSRKTGRFEGVSEYDAFSSWKSSQHESLNADARNVFGTYEKPLPKSSQPSGSHQKQNSSQGRFGNKQRTAATGATAGQHTSSSKGMEFLQQACYRIITVHLLQL